MTLSDVQAFVSFRVNEGSSPVSRSPESRKQGITARVTEQSEGLFLYASLVMDQFSKDMVSSDAAVDRTLNRLPEGLDEVYRHALNIPMGSDRGTDAIQWLMVSMRTLSWEELRTGLSVIDGKFREDEWIDESCESFIGHSCGPLIEAVGDIPRFIHTTVKDFLGTCSTVSFTVPSAHTYVCKTLLAILKWRLPRRNNEESMRAYIERVSEQRAWALYQYAVFNWYKHLKQCSTKIEDERESDGELESSVMEFLFSNDFLEWLKMATAARHFQRDGTDIVTLTVDVTDCLTCWVNTNKWPKGTTKADELRAWTSHFAALMLDWGEIIVLHGYDPHNIPQKFLPPSNHFHDLIGPGNDFMVQFRSTQLDTRGSIRRPEWLKQCFAVDTRRGLAYSLQDRLNPVLNCYHMGTGLVAARMNLSLLGLHAPMKGILSPNERFLALVIEDFSPENTDKENVTHIHQARQGLQLKVIENERKEPVLAWRLEYAVEDDETSAYSSKLGIKGNERRVLVVELRYEGLSRTNLFSTLAWTTDPLVTSYETGIRWSIDEPDLVSFSPDSTQLFSPHGIFNLDTGNLQKLGTLISDGALRSARISGDLQTLAFIRGRKTLEVISPLNSRDPQKIDVSDAAHLLAISPEGRFFLLLTLHLSKSTKALAKKSNTRGQEGKISIFDMDLKRWSVLLKLEPKTARRQHSWKFHSAPSSPEFVTGVKDQVPHRVALFAPKGWKIAKTVQLATMLKDAASADADRILVFEGDKGGIEFGSNPTLKHAVPVQEQRIGDLFNPFNDRRILSWGTHLESAIVAVEDRIEEIEVGKMASMFGSFSKPRSENNGTITDAPSRSCAPDVEALLFSNDMSDAYRIEIGSRDTAAAKASPQCSAGLQKIKTAISRVRGDDTLPSEWNIEITVPLYEYLAFLRRPSISIDADGRLVFGQLQVGLEGDEEDENPYELDEESFGAAWETLTRQLSPFSADCSTAQPSPDGLLKKLSVFDRTSPSDFRTGVDQESWIARAATSQEDVDMFILMRRLNLTQDQKAQGETSQWETIFGLYSNSLSKFTWTMHTTTGGARSQLYQAGPEIAWRLHPNLPLLAWFLPGHSLRISHIASENPSINIAGQ